MAIRTILQLGNPLLWEQASVLDPRSLEVPSVIQDLSDTLRAFREARGFGRGIAAPQIGVLKRLIFIRMTPTGFCGPMLNPAIVWASDRQIELWDDCFSFPDLMVRVRRGERVRVRYVDEAGAEQLLEAAGDLSELLQHEIDHLDGILATDRAISGRAFATRAEWSRALREPPGSTGPESLHGRAYLSSTMTAQEKG
jgi:peptide deformylase